MRQTVTVMGYATGYGFKVLDRFVGSLFRTGFRSTVVIIGRPSDKAAFVALKHQYPIFDLQLAMIPADFQVRNITNLRFDLYEKWLRRGTIKTDYIMLSDVGDVMFQRNPEEFELTADLYATAEGGRADLRIIKNCQYNGGWAHRLALEIVAYQGDYSCVIEKPILCAGTIIGRTGVIGRLVRDLNMRIVEMLTTPLPPDGIRFVNKTGLDQILYNYVVHFGRLEGVDTQILTNDEPLVNTVQPERTQVTSEGKVVDKYGNVYYIVHQYNRLPMALRRLMSVANAPFDFTI